ncbi:MAG: transposase [Planctomycetota bacterium]
MDAKPLVVSPYRKAKAARRARAYNRKSRGYKLFMITDLCGYVVAWDVRGMGTAEPEAAKPLTDHLDRPGDLIGDSVYDANPLHQHAAGRQAQLIAPRMRPGAG